MSNNSVLIIVSFNTIETNQLFNAFLQKNNISEEQFYEILSMMDDNALVNHQPIDNQPIIEQYENIALCQQFNSSKNHY